MKFLTLQVLLFCTFSLLYAAPIEEVVEEENFIGIFGNHFQGDISLTPEQEQALLTGGRNGRTGILDLNFRWPKIGNLVHVPYVISSEYSSKERKMIIDAMDEIHEKTCIRFVPRTNQIDYVNVTNTNDGCYSKVGRVGGAQIVALAVPGCFVHGKIMHEFYHALGFDHMHSHTDRDSYVKINFENIEDGKASQFDIVNINGYGNFDTPYDFDSTMHYGPYFFSKNGQMTIQPLNPDNEKRMGQEEKLSEGDVLRMNRMYNCFV
ncbi:hypothetical protein PVAND_003314 [Polypedilum vanderplanki]|uniref:Metalloendopeptidase n=1 Tax=Polypedilum vanderplanki TaxID=319348 RepID=A0A9J6BUR4_POLVA|nr:hypothetical protein PVAND_003314 [Polypedilum vanderplanki]